MAEGRGDFVLRKTCLLDHIHSLLGQNWRFQLLKGEESGPGIQSGSPSLKPAITKQGLHSFRQFQAVWIILDQPCYIFHLLKLAWLCNLSLPGRCLARGWSELIWCHRMKGPNGEWAARTSQGLSDALVMWAGYFVSLGKWSDGGPGDHLLGRELVPQLWQKGGAEVGYRMTDHLDCWYLFF